MRKRPELQGQLLAKGGWDYALVDPLKPQPGDIVVPKTRYSAFFNSTFDSTPARSRYPQPGVHRHRHQCLRGVDPARRFPSGVFRCGAGPMPPIRPGPAFAQQAALFNIETFFGWVSSVDDFCTTFAPVGAVS